MNNILLEPYKLNDKVTLANRIVMAPMTRSFADDNLVPTPEMAQYYAKRAAAGLIITEGAIISPNAQGYPNTPGIFTQEQTDGWKTVTEAVHQAGGKIFLQIWHTGRVAHSHFTGGLPPLAPSPVQLEGSVPRTRELTYETPQALTADGISEVISQFATAAKNAMEANFDGVEIHGANGYLIDQFLHQETNQRNDEYGGSPENRARFALEVTNAVTKAIGEKHVGLRLSPAAYFNLTHTEGDEKTFTHILTELNTLNLAYVHVGIFDDSQTFDYLHGRVSEFIRKHYTGTLIGCGSYTIEQAISEIETKKIDLIAIGRALIANPDLIQKIKEKQPLEPYQENQLLTLT